MKRTIITKTCSIPECNSRHYGRTWCKKHWFRWRAHGDPNFVKSYHDYHGLTGTREYKIWSAIKYRCNSEKCWDYGYYGGRGIKVCDRWTDEKGFRSFLKDMGKMPTPKHTIDRVDNDGDYTPENCRWATRKQQASNQRMFRTNTSGVKGVGWYKPTKKWKAQIYIKGKTTSLGYFTDKEEAIKTRKKAEKLYYEY